MMFPLRLVRVSRHHVVAVTNYHSMHLATGYAIDTKEQEGWFAGSLTYVHMALMCEYPIL